MKEFILPYQTAEDMKKAEQKRSRLYSRFNSVKVEPYGLIKIRIIATNNK